MNRYNLMPFAKLLHRRSITTFALHSTPQIRRPSLAKRQNHTWADLTVAEKCKHRFKYFIRASIITQLLLRPLKAGDVKGGY